MFSSAQRYKIWKYLGLPKSEKDRLNEQLDSLIFEFGESAYQDVVDILSSIDAIESNAQINAISRDAAIKKAAVLEWEVGGDIQYSISRKEELVQQLKTMILDLPKDTEWNGITFLYKV